MKPRRSSELWLSLDEIQSRNEGTLRRAGSGRLRLGTEADAITRKSHFSISAFLDKINKSLIASYLPKRRTKRNLISVVLEGKSKNARRRHED
jgi:hypothetical protein